MVKTISIKPHPPTLEGNGGWFSFRISNSAGTKPTIKVIDRDQMGQPTDSDAYQIVWSPSPDTDDWREFDNLTILDAENNLVASNNTAFTDETIWVANGPFYSRERLEADISRWVADPLTSPTESAISGYVVGTFPQITAPRDGRVVGPFDCFAFKVGTGNKKISLTSAQHPSENLADFAFVSSVDWLLSDDADAVDMRSRCTAYVYPDVNAYGRAMGHAREDENEIDANRTWEGGITNESNAIYRPVFTTDAGTEGFSLSADYHTFGSAQLSSAVLFFHAGDATTILVMDEIIAVAGSGSKITSSNTSSLRTWLPENVGSAVPAAYAFELGNRLNGISYARAQGINHMKGIRNSFIAGHI